MVCGVVMVFVFVCLWLDFLEIDLVGMYWFFVGVGFM